MSTRPEGFLNFEMVGGVVAVLVAIAVVITTMTRTVTMVKRDGCRRYDHHIHHRKDAGKLDKHCNGCIAAQRNQPCDRWSLEPQWSYHSQ